MGLRTSLKRKLRRVVRKLFKKNPKSRGRSTIGPAFELKTDQPFRLLGLPIELLLQILEILLPVTPVKSSRYQHPLVSLRL